jgi:Flagellar basal body-associated protein
MASNTENSGIYRAIQWLLLAAVVAVGVANLYLLLQSREGQQEFASASVKRTTSSAPIFVDVGPLTVNLQNDAYGQRLLYIGLTLQVSDFETRDLLNRHMPEVQSRLLLLLSGQNAEQLIPATGKQKLAQDIKGLFQTPLAQMQMPVEVEQVLFTNFIVQ